MVALAGEDIFFIIFYPHYFNANFYGFSSSGFFESFFFLGSSATGYLLS